MSTPFRPLCAGLLLAVSALTAVGQPALQSPEEFLGYALGERFTPHHRVVAYVEHVAAAQPNVELRPYGTTYEGRPLVYLVVSSEENMARLDAIRTDNLRRVGLLDGEPTIDDVALVWLSYNVHGNESVSTEAALQTLHTLAAAADPEVRAWLDRTVVVIDPCINPDGRDRYVHFYQQARGATPNPDPAGVEHHEPWPGGRTNHYFFDLNRDWAWQTQRESRARIAAYNEWMPHIHVDFHEQGIDSPYYFAPAAEPYHPVITDWQRDFQADIGANHARYFDANGWLYFTREVFDLFYPSYGDTWPTFNGAVGMTYEQAGSGRAGLAVETAAGDTLTLTERILHHYTTSLSTVEIAAMRSQDLVREFGRYFEEARTNPPGRYTTYLLKHDDAPGRVAAALELLDRQGIRYGMADTRQTLRGFSYRRGEEASVTIEPDDILISAFQPKASLLSALFEPDAVLPDSVTYDITAWAVPYAYGLDAYALDQRFSPGPPPGDLLAPTAEADAAAPANAGAAVYAFLSPWESTTDLRLLATLLEAGVDVRFSRRPFTVEGRSYDAGTLVVTRADNRQPGFEAAVRAAAEAVGRPVTAVSTGFTPAGPDFGSSNVRFIEKPHVALLSGEGTSSYAVGQVWHYFDEQIGYPLTRIGTDYFDDVDLDDIDVLILPDGYYGEFIDERTRERLLDWIRGGGRLIALERAAGALADTDGFGIERRRPETDEDEADEEYADAVPARYGDRERDDLRRAVQGSIYALTLDNTHPLGFGYPGTYFTLRRDDAVYELLSDGWNVGTLREGSYRTGFVGADVRPLLDEGLIFGVESIGDGSVVYMADNPLYRGFWETGRLLFGNAVFFVGQ